MDVGPARDARGVRSVEAATAMWQDRQRDEAWKRGRRRGGTCSEEGLLLVDERRIGFLRWDPLLATRCRRETRPEPARLRGSSRAWGLGGQGCCGGRC